MESMARRASRSQARPERSRFSFRGGTRDSGRESPRCGLATVEIRTTDVRTAEVSVAKVRARQVGADQLGRAQARPMKVSSAELGVAQVRVRQPRVRQVAIAQVGANELASPKIGPRQIGLAWFVWRFHDLPRTRLVPLREIATEQLQIAVVCHRSSFPPRE